MPEVLGGDLHHWRPSVVGHHDSLLLACDTIIGAWITFGRPNATTSACWAPMMSTRNPQASTRSKNRNEGGPASIAMNSSRAPVSPRQARYAS